MADKTFKVSFLDKAHEPIRIMADSVEDHGESYVFFDDGSVVSMVPRNIVLNVVEQFSLDED